MAKRNHSNSPVWVDCSASGNASGAELLLVEGQSALHSVVAVRDPQLQAVLALQGKPLNVSKASAKRVAAHLPFVALAQALGLTDSWHTDAAAVKAPVSLCFERVLLLFDPDADGIHITALMILYLHRYLPWLITEQRVLWVHAPMRAPEGAGSLPTAGAPYRGLGSIEPAVLRELCVAPATRQAHRVQAVDVGYVIANLAPRTRPFESG